MAAVQSITTIGRPTANSREVVVLLDNGLLEVFIVTTIGGVETWSTTDGRVIYVFNQDSGTTEGNRALLNALVDEVLATATHTLSDFFDPDSVAVLTPSELAEKARELTVDLLFGLEPGAKPPTLEEIIKTIREMLEGKDEPREPQPAAENQDPPDEEEPPEPAEPVVIVFPANENFGGLVFPGEHQSASELAEELREEAAAREAAEEAAAEQALVDGGLTDAAAAALAEEMLYLQFYYSFLLQGFSAEEADRLARLAVEQALADGDE